jgi:hypothetical protein
MNARLLRLIALLLFNGVILTSCTPCEQKGDRIENGALAAVESVENTEREHLEALEAFRDESLALTISNEQMIAEMKFIASEYNAAIRADYQARIENLEEWNDNLKERLANFRADEPSNWRTFTAVFRQDMDALEIAINDLNSPGGK